MKIFQGITTLCICVLLALFSTKVAAQTDEPIFTGYERYSQYVAMPDGVNIAVDYYLPVGYIGDEEFPPAEFPVIFRWTPYDRTQIDPATGTIVDGMQDHISFFTSHGYAWVAADMRGTGASYGWFLDFSEDIAEDGAELVDWIADQSWSDGNVGMSGGSYEGISQLYTASRGPDALKCILPFVAPPTDLYDSGTYPGGIWSYAFAHIWSAAATYVLRPNLSFPGLFMPSAPAVDEDGDGEYHDEIPIDLNGDGLIVGDYPYPVDPSSPPQYSDGQPRSLHHYFNATMEHFMAPDGSFRLFDIVDYYEDVYFIDEELGDTGLTPYDLNPTRYIADAMDSGIPVMFHEGWFDLWPRNVFLSFGTMRQSSPARIMVVPKYHQYLAPPELAVEFGTTQEEIYQFEMVEAKRWYDRWLKGIDNDVENEPILLFVMHGGGWRVENEWPLARQMVTNLKFDGDGELSLERAVDGFDLYVADYSHHSGDVGFDVSWTAMLDDPPVTNTFYINRHTAIGVTPTPPNIPRRNEADESCLTYTSPVLLEDAEITGHPIVHLWVSSTEDYGDLFFYLEDIDEEGNAIHVTDHQLRVGFNTLVDNDRMIEGIHDVDVEPELPWHGFEAADYTDRVFEGGRIVEVTRDLHPTSWVFRAGHRIRVSIAASDWPTFRLHPELSPANHPDDPETVIPELTIYRDERFPSGIELPVIPTKASICSALGDGHFNYDLDVYQFQGDEGESIVISLDENPAGSGAIAHAMVMLIDALSFEEYLVQDIGLPPFEIDVTLPNSGRYFIVVFGTSAEPGAEADYRLILEANRETFLSLDSHWSVEQSQQCPLFF